MFDLEECLAVFDVNGLSYYITNTLLLQ